MSIQLSLNEVSEFITRFFIDHQNGVDPPAKAKNQHHHLVCEVRLFSLAGDIEYLFFDRFGY